MEQYLRDHFGDSCKYRVMPELREIARKQRYPTALDSRLTLALQRVVGGEQASRIVALVVTIVFCKLQRLNQVRGESKYISGFIISSSC